MSVFNSFALGSNPASTTDQPAPPAVPLSWIGAALIASALVVGLLMRGAGLSIDPTAPGTLHFAVAFVALAAIRWGCRLHSSAVTRIVGDVCEYFGLLTAISLLGAVASYPLASYSRGSFDHALYRSDVALHFDWVIWYKVVATYPLLQILDRAAYAMIYVSPAILLGYLAITDQRREAQNFLAAVWVSAAITLVVFRFIPAVGPFAYRWHGPIPYMPVSGLWQPQLIPQLRDHAISLIDLNHLVGLVSAPSFHAAAGVVMIAFALRQPTIRAPLVAANVAMLLSTPVEGTHYFTDVILGAVVAFISLALIALAPPKPIFAAA